MADDPENIEAGEDPPRRRCWIYKDRRRGETYLYLARRDDFKAAPDALLDALGALDFVMELELHPERPLARASVTHVMSSLEEQGYYLQLPPVDTPGRRRLQ
jgi:uncharacterized protein YcgL (UPF0745 family)